MSQHEARAAFLRLLAEADDPRIQRNGDDPFLAAAVDLAQSAILWKRDVVVAKAVEQVMTLTGTPASEAVAIAEVLVDQLGPFMLAVEQRPPGAHVDREAPDPDWEPPLAYGPKSGPCSGSVFTDLFDALESSGVDPHPTIVEYVCVPLRDVTEPEIAELVDPSGPNGLEQP